MNVRRPDTYPEKNHRDFRTVIFGAKKFFTKNRIFSIFANKLDKKKSYFWKRTVSFEREKWVEFFDVKSVEIQKNYGRKNLFKENGKKIATLGILNFFLENVYFKFCHRCLKHQKKSIEYFSRCVWNYRKIWILEFYSDFVVKIRILSHSRCHSKIH